MPKGWLGRSDEGDRLPINDLGLGFSGVDGLEKSAMANLPATLKRLKTNLEGKQNA
jgi:hypothetical protein